MTYPTNEARQAELHHTLAVDFYNGAKDDPTAWQRQPEPTQVQALLGGRHHEASDTEVFQMARTPWQRGSIAGEVLIVIASLAQHHGGGSVNKACHILAEAGKAGVLTSGLASLYTHQKTIHKLAWEPYWSVAHLWAAHNLMQNFRVSEEARIAHPLRPWWTDRDGFTRFLGFAEAWRAWGESYIPHGRKKYGPLLLPQETWRVPDGTPLSQEYAATPPSLAPLYKKHHQTYKA